MRQYKYLIVNDKQQTAWLTNSNSRLSNNCIRHTGGKLQEQAHTLTQAITTYYDNMPMTTPERLAYLKREQNNPTYDHSYWLAQYLTSKITK